MSTHHIPNALTKTARELRTNHTEVEKKLWYRIRNRQLGAKFRRQHPVGCYVADFACEEEKLIIELDGGQHNESHHQLRDGNRTEALAAQGWRVLRFWNHEVNENIEGVLLVISASLTQKGSAFPSPEITQE